jgi:hypothetical protein
MIRGGGQGTSREIRGRFKAIKDEDPRIEPS